MCFVWESICCHTFIINIFGKSYENNYCKAAFNKIFSVEIPQFRVRNNKKLLIFELLNFAVFSLTVAYFLSYLTPAPFLWEQVRPATTVLLYTAQVTFYKVPETHGHVYFIRLHVCTLTQTDKYFRIFHLTVL